MSAVILKHGDIGPAVKEVRDRLVHLGLLADTKNIVVDGAEQPGEKTANSNSDEIFDDELLAGCFFAIQANTQSVQP